MRTMANSQSGLNAMELPDEMLALGVLPDLQTSSSLMEHLVGAGDIKGVHRTWCCTASCCSVGTCAVCWSRACYKLECAALTLRVFDEMCTNGVATDTPRKALLIKSLYRRIKTAWGNPCRARNRKKQIFGPSSGVGTTIS
ncbi:hypothetical protein ACP70R_037845 [Stipagrostis hirtigluma subsp. patula]